ncbi:glycosyltransferase [Kibdelosporangium aridum]|nr:glycosyltransferase [Kibdelosporangium aridum]
MTIVAIALLLAWPLYNVVLAVFGWRRPRPRQPEHTTGLHFWIVIPALHEQKATLLESVLALDSAEYPVRALVVDRDVDALNAAYRVIKHTAVEQGIERRTVIGVLDGRPEPGLIREVARYFGGRNVGAVQCHVRIHSPITLLAFLQDLEFAVVGDSSQRMRDVLGSVELGENGQFVRLDALARLGDRPWTASLEHRLYQAGMSIRYATDAVISQDAPPVRFRKWAPAAISGALVAVTLLTGTYVWLAALLVPGLIWGLVHRARFGGQSWRRTLVASVLYPIYLGRRRRSPSRVTNVVPSAQPRLLPWAGGNPGLSARRP